MSNPNIRIADNSSDIHLCPVSSSSVSSLTHHSDTLTHINTNSQRHTHIYYGLESIFHLTVVPKHKLCSYRLQRREIIYNHPAVMGGEGERDRSCPGGGGYPGTLGEGKRICPKHRCENSLAHSAEKVCLRDVHCVDSFKKRLFWW